MNMSGKWPAIVRTADREKREYRVEIPGLTDGAELFPLAQIAYPIGDKSEHTEIRILVGDRVWVEFECGRSDSPIITHFRTKQSGNVVNFRRFHHENIETDADATQSHTAGTNYSIDAGDNVTITAGTKITLAVGESRIEITAAQIVATAKLLAQAGMSITGTVDNNGTNIGSTHTHTEQGDGQEVSQPH